MANHKSTKKRALQTVKRTLARKSKLASAKTKVKAFLTATKSKNKDEATKLLNAAKSDLAKLASKKILKKKTASRLTSRLTAKVNAL